MWKKALASMFMLSLVVFGLMGAFLMPVRAAGGGDIQSAGTNNNGGTSSCAVTLSNVVSGDFLIMSVEIAKGTTVSSISDGTNSFSKVITSAVNVDVEQWIEKFTLATGSVTATAMLSGSASNKCSLSEIDNLLSTTADSTSTGSGSSASSPIATAVTTFTPPAGDFCFADTGDFSAGGQTASGQAPTGPWIAERQTGATGNTRHLYTFTDSNSLNSANTAPNSITFTTAASDTYDEVAACYPAGITTATSTTSTTTSTTTTTTETATTSTTTTNTVPVIVQGTTVDWAIILFPVMIGFIFLLMWGARKRS